MVYIILVNWNGWRDTIECLESVFRLRYQKFRVIVCDNGSEDGSLERISEWAKGDIEAGCSNSALRHLSFPPHPKPIPYATVSPGEVIHLTGWKERLLLVPTGANLGFAGGNNVGLRIALSTGDLDYAWLLNNDTVVHPDSLSALVNGMNQRPDAGLCGSTLLYYHKPDLIQALGGSIYNHWLARVGHIGLGQHISERPPREEVERRMRYVAGASMVVSRKLLDRIGLMNESYFLYFEELDWATRAKGYFSLAYIPESIVYHKEGSAAKSDYLTRRRSPTTEFYATRNRVLFTRVYYPRALMTVFAAATLTSLPWLLNGKWRNFHSHLNGCTMGLRAKIPEVFGESRKSDAN